MYFSKFPAYITKIGNDLVQIEDIFARIVVGKTYGEISSILVPYLVREDETIEQLANKYYGSPFYHWVIILINNIVDPREEWPASSNVLFEKVFAKYEYKVTCTANVPFRINEVITTSDNSEYQVTDVNSNVMLLKFIKGNKYLTKNKILTGSAGTAIISQVVDPTEFPHHYENSAGIEVDFDPSLEAQEIITKVTNYDYELRLNEKKRTIKLLNKRYLGDFVKNLEAELDL